MKKKKLKLTKKRIALLIVVVVIAALLYPVVYTEMLKAAIRDNNTSGVKVLLAMPGDVDFRVYAPRLEIEGFTALEVACWNGGDYEMIELLLQNGASPNNDPDFDQPIQYVLGGRYEGMLDRAKLFVEYGADLNLEGGYDKSSVGSLFKRRDYEKYKDKMTLDEANAEVLSTFIYLTEHGAHLEAKQPYVIYEWFRNTIENENYKLTEYLVRTQRFDINMQVDLEFNETLLMSAAKRGNSEAIEFLLRLGADKSLEDDAGKTAYDYAVENDHLEAATLLVVPIKN